jgi:hypothetical protein
LALSTTTLKTKVAQLYGLGGDTTAEAQALQALDEAISEMNMELWDVLLARSESVAMVADTETVTLPTLMYKEKDAYWVRTSDSQKGPPMTYLDWITFKRMYNSVPVSSTGLPRVYSTFGDEATVYLAPTPNDDAADNFTLTFEYYTRLRSATVADADDQSLDVPAEWEVPLLHKARQFYALMVAGPDSKDIGTFQVMYNDAITNLREIDRRHPDETTRFRMYDRSRGTRRTRAGGLYTKID